MKLQLHKMPNFIVSILCIIPLQVSLIDKYFVKKAGP